MLRKSFLIQAKPGMAAEYKRRHDEIWPELTSIFSEHGIKNFSINLHAPSGYLFGYIELEDEEKYNAIGEYEVCKKWWKYMAEVLVCEKEGDQKGKEEILDEVFFFQR